MLPPSQSSLSGLSNTRKKASPEKLLCTLLGHFGLFPSSFLRFVCTHSELIRFSTTWSHPPTALFENSVLLETFRFLFLRHMPVSCKVIKGVLYSSLSLLVKHIIPLPWALPGCLPRLLRAPVLITTVAHSLALVFHIFSLFSLPLPSQFLFRASVLMYSLDLDMASLIFMFQLLIPASFTAVCLSRTFSPAPSFRVEVQLFLLSPFQFDGAFDQKIYKFTFCV